MKILQKYISTNLSLKISVIMAPMTRSRADNRKVMAIGGYVEADDEMPSHTIINTAKHYRKFYKGTFYY